MVKSDILVCGLSSFSIMASYFKSEKDIILYSPLKNFITDDFPSNYINLDENDYAEKFNYLIKEYGG